MLRFCAGVVAANSFDRSFEVSR